MNAIKLFSNKICKLIKNYKTIVLFKNRRKNIISLDCLENVQSQKGSTQAIFMKNLNLKTKILR